MCVLDSKAFECFIIILWNIWNARNLMVYHGKVQEPKITWERAINFCKEFQLYNFNNEVMLFKPVRGSTWKKSPPGCIKINIDAA